jgi:hypothetical protein
MTAKTKEPSKGGRPSSYKPEYAEQVQKLSRLGATDKEMADFFGVAESTFHKWKIDYPQFSESLKVGKLLSDAEVSNKLYHRALGYSHEDVDIRVVAGEIVKTSLIKHYPPDTTACIFWLKNRQPEKWRDKTEVAADSATIAEVLKDLADKLPD